MRGFASAPDPGECWHRLRMRWAMRTMLSLAGLLTANTAMAQESASFKLNEHVFNAAGHPVGGTVVSSARFRITLDAVGEDVVSRGLNSASFNMDAGMIAAYRPPTEVVGLTLTDKTTLEWDPERSAGSYILYRDLMSNLTGLGFGNCEQEDLLDPTTTDGDAVPSDDGYFYLVTVENRIREEGTKGVRSSGVERLGTVCP